MNSSHRLHDPSIDNSCWSAKSLAVITIIVVLIVAAAAGRADGQATPTWDHLDLGSAKVVDGVIRMIAPETRIQTKETFTGPIEIVVVAKTEKNNIRLNAFNGAAVLFNWEVNREALRVNRPDGNETRESGSVAIVKVKPLEANTWYTLRWRITEQGMEIFQNDKVVYSERKAYNLSAQRPVFIMSADSALDVKAFNVTRLHKTEVAQKPEPREQPKEPKNVGEDRRQANKSQTFSVIAPDGLKIRTLGPKSIAFISPKGDAFGFFRVQETQANLDAKTHLARRIGIARGNAKNPELLKEGQFETDTGLNVYWAVLEQDIQRLGIGQDRKIDAFFVVQGDNGMVYTFDSYGMGQGRAELIPSFEKAVRSFQIKKK